MIIKKWRLIFLCLFLSHNTYFTLSFKGVWTSIQHFPLFTSAFWQSFGQGFGASPSGYIYSFKVYNDLNIPVYCTINEIISFMGGDLPKPHGLTLHTIAPGSFLKIIKQPFYFEMLLKTTPRRYSSNMPYLEHDDVIGRFEGLTLADAQNDPNIYLYHTFMKRIFKNGNFVHEPSSELVGYSQPSSNQNKGNATIASQLSSLTIFNSSSQGYYVGFTKQSTSTMTEASCEVFDFVPAHSFALLSSFGSINSLAPGKIGVFDEKTKGFIKEFALPMYVFQTLPSGQSKNYTLEIYQEIVQPNQTATLQMNLQGLMPGNFDQPIGLVRDITPVIAVFWFQGAASGSANLSGKTWVLIKNDQEWTIQVGVTAGSAVQFQLIRPKNGTSLWIYFVYVDTTDDAQATAYLHNLVSQSFGTQAFDRYHNQAEYQYSLAKQAQTVSASISPSMLTDASRGVLSLRGGQIQDPSLGIVGYLLGADVFFSRGVGAGPMYYVLSASGSSTTQPVQTVQNYFIATVGSTQAPAGMPTPTVV